MSVCTCMENKNILFPFITYVLQFHLCLWASHVPIYYPYSSSLSFQEAWVPSPWVRAGPSDLLLPNRAWQKRWNITSKIKFWRLLRQLYFLSGFSCLLSQMPCCEVAYVGTYKTKNKGRPLANSQQKAETLSPIACQELKPAQNHLSELRSGFSSTWALS